MEKLIVATILAVTLSMTVLGFSAVSDLNDGRVLRAVSSIVQAGNVAQAR